MFIRRLRKIFILSILVAGGSLLSGCGMNSVEGSGEINMAAHDALAETGLCQTNMDCRNKCLVFWDGNEKRVYLNFYVGSKKVNPSLIEKAILKRKEEIGMHTTVMISFYNKTKDEMENIYKMIFVSPYYRKDL
ncbi:hypothetical protein OK116_08305 [Xylella fastidiosa subsp. fastidiosa]|jgi:predicted small secreted protein|nr:hypothetical protein [Xylella fastidiosa]EGO82145.1 hypothetical protein XFEB_00887 [Xylella fastidiosa EB92.1]MDC7964095.1 hypothetical protein [Xylella fastidiosa]UIT49512.1 hypothetical protein LZ752_08125 [Xylella fastidiosa subsp. fastidiosa]UIT51663.1 hypothetical protein LZ753_08055 [Xylella fastidiosa subsp. fastidiosa]WCF15456.1 hypothetical protein OK115_02520 [Xylella fastidiosa subsp. fastidiosa]